MSNVRNHIESRHFPNTFSYTCRECPAVFGTFNALNMHQRTHRKHCQVWCSLWINLSRILVFTYPILGVVQSPEDLKQYIVIGERGPSCGVCHTFSHHSKTNVLRHIESKHFPNAFLYQCTSCGVAKQTKTALERHMSKCISRLWLLPHLIHFVQGRFPDQRILTNTSFPIKLLAVTLVPFASSSPTLPSQMWGITSRAVTFPTVLSTTVNTVVTTWARRRRYSDTRLGARVDRNRIFCIDSSKVE